MKIRQLLLLPVFVFTSVFSQNPIIVNGFDDVNVFQETQVIYKSYQDAFVSTVPTDEVIKVVAKLDSTETLVEIEVDSINQFLKITFPKDSLGETSVELEASYSFDTTSTSFNVRVLPSAATLYQQGISGGPGITSQVFTDLGGPVYAADDFDVPSGVVWDVNKIATSGTKNALDIDSVHIVIFSASQDFTMLPDSIVYSDSLVQATAPDNPDIVVELAETVSLTEGKYWVSVMPIMPFQGNAGRWFWGRTSDVHGVNYHLRDPGNLFGAGCFDWTDGTVFNGTFLNLVFSVYGELSGTGVMGPDLSGNFVADYVDDNLVNLSWDKEEDAFGYILKRGLSLESMEEIAKVVPSDSVEMYIDYGDLGLEPNQYVYYSLQAYDAAGGGSVLVDSVLALPSTPIASPVTNVSMDGAQLNWEMTSTQEYVFSLASDSAFTTLAIVDSLVSGSLSSLVVESLSPNMMYYFKIAALNATGASEYSNVSTFLTLPSNPTTEEASEIMANSFQVNWNLINADSFKVEVSDEMEFQEPVLLSVILSNDIDSLIVEDLMANKEYYYRLSALNASDMSAYSDTVSVLTAPLAPKALAATEITDSSFKANWEMGNAEEYRVDVSLDEEFTTLVVSDSTVDGSIMDIEISSLESDMMYYYRIAALNQTAMTGYTDTVAVLTSPSIPVALPASSVSSASFVANWELNSAEYFVVDVSEDASFSTFLVQDSMVSNELDFLEIGGLSSDKMYYYRVAASNATAKSSYSSAISVKTETETGLVGNPVLGLSIYPTVVEDLVTVEIDNSYLGRIELNILDVKGLVIKELEFTKADFYFNSSLSVGGLGAGAYFLVVKQGNYTKVTPIVKR